MISADTQQQFTSKFKAPQWAANANIYEVNVRQYTPEGTLKAFRSHLPRLARMGVSILWFMPLTPISIQNRKGSLGSYYACCDHTAIHPEYGSMDDFRVLVEQAHALGIKVLVDIVANHTGWDHTWTKTHPEYYKTNDEGEFFDSHGWADVIDLDYENQGLRKEMIAAMRFWVEACNVDGFRCDMAHLIPLDFWREARLSLQDNKELFWLAETEEPAYHQVFDCTFTWRALHLMEEMYKSHKGIKDLLALLEAYADDFPENGQRLYFISNHDENSHSGSEYERLGHSVKAFSVFCATTFNSIPLLYSGQEIPEKRRLLFFEKDAIQWNCECMMENFYRELLLLRQRNSALWAGDPSNEMVLVETTDNTQHILAYVRNNHKDAVLAMLNLSPYSMIRFRLSNLVETGTYKSIWSGLELEIDEDTEFEMQAWEYLVFEKLD